MKNIILTLLISIVFIFVLGLGNIAHAAIADCASGSGDLIGLGCVEEGSGLTKTDPRIITVRIINAILGLLGIVATVLVIYAGFLWMTAGGNDEQVGKAKKILISAIIGLVIILSAWAITSFVLKNLYYATTGRPLGGVELW